jgi:hypothetical protein
MSMQIHQALIRAYAQWEAQSFHQLTHRGGVPADVHSSSLENGMQSAFPNVIRDAAAVVTAYVLGLRESSVMSLPTESDTITGDGMPVQLVLVKCNPFRLATPAAHVKTGTAGLPSPIDLVKRWMACGNDPPCWSADLAAHPRGDLAAYRRPWQVRWKLCRTTPRRELAGHRAASV